MEQDFKFIPAAGEQKRKAFDKLLLEKIPGISQGEIEHFREAICGKVNAGIVSSGVLAPAYDSTKDTADVVGATTVQPAQK